MKKNKICIVSGGILPIPDVKGGAIEHLMTMIVEDNEKYNQMDITIISVYNEEAIEKQKEFSKTTFVNLKPSRRNDGFFYRLRESVRWRLLRLFAYDIHFKNTYISLVDNYIKRNGHNFDLFISEGYDIEAMVTASKLFGKEKVCWHLHMNPPFSKRTDEIYGKCVAVSNYIINRYREQSNNDKSNTGVIFNAIDTDIFQQSISENEKNELRKSLGIDHDDFVVVFCGRIVKVKGIEELINAIIQINNPKIKLLIIGSSNFGEGDKGEFPKKIRQIVSEHSDIIKFTGFVSNNNVYKYHKISNIGVIPSTYQDPCPLSMFEMIASGLPTIATAAGGMPEIGNTDSTIFISLDNITEKIYESILNLYENPELCKKMKMAALKRSAEFTRDKYYNNFCFTLNNLINGNNKL